ncbi:unnamed protein product [Rotaria sordida]|uniref:Uncharacterized protein n=1 Tax=Rotaria sordida TaxID=392033 RepID=A0A815ADS3_9BILA|nr:unnamed protein product [Rotaria sordida]
MKLKFLFVTEPNVIKCSTHEYLIFTNWHSVSKWNISCPNQTELFETNPPHLIEETQVYVACFESDMILNPYLMLNYTKMKKGMIKNPCESSILSSHSLPDLTGIVNNTYHQYSFKAKCVDSQIFINLSSISFSSTSNEIHTMYTKFNTQPVICRFMFNQSELVRNKTCMVNATLTVRKLCYYDPQLKTISKEVDWNLLDNFFTNPSYAPSHWQTKNGYYYNDKLLTTTITISVSTDKTTTFSTVSTTISTTTVTKTDTTKSTTSFTTSETTTFLTVSTTISATTMTEVDTTEDTTSFTTTETTTFSMVSTTISTTTMTKISTTPDTTSFRSSDITTLFTISTASSPNTFTEFDTTVLSTSSHSPTLTTTIISDILTSSIESSTSIITTSIQSSEIPSSIITTTTADHISDTIFETMSTTLFDTGTTSYINVNNNTTSKKSSKSSKTSKTSTSTTSMIPLNTLSPTKESSSYIKYIIFLLSIIGIILLISCLVYLYQHHRNRSSESLLDRNDSDESYDPSTTESELDPSNESVEESTAAHTISELPILLPQLQQSKSSSKQTTGRIFSKLDPDNL